MNVAWEQGRFTKVAVRAAGCRSSVRDSLWVSLMSAGRSLDAAMEDRFMGFPRRPAARATPRAGLGSKAGTASLSEWSTVSGSAEDRAFIALGFGSFVMLAYCFWQMCLSVS